MQNVVDGVGRRTILGRFSFILSTLVLIWLVEACSICAGAPPGRARNSVVRPELVWDAGSDALLDYWWVSGDRMILKFRRVRSGFDGAVVMRQVNVHTHALSERAAGLAGRDLTGAIPSPSGSMYLLHDRADGMHAYWDVLSDDGAIVCRKADLTLNPPRGVYWLPGGREWYEYNFGGPEENILIRYVVDNSRPDNTDETAPAKYVCRTEGSRSAWQGRRP